MALPVDSKAGSTMGLNTMMYNAILESEYFKELEVYDQFDEIVDEIYNTVDNLDPTVQRGDNAASSAWCLMYKLFTLKLTNHQMKRLITHHDSPYIRGIGFLYLRMCLPAKYLWDWYEQYLDDEERLNFQYTTATEGTHTIGKLVRTLLLDAKFLSVMLPRIPVPVEKQLKAKLKEHALANPRKVEESNDSEKRRDNGRSTTPPGENRRSEKDDRRDDRDRNDSYRRDSRRDDRGRDDDRGRRDRYGRDDRDRRDRGRSDRDDRRDRGRRYDDDRRGGYDDRRDRRDDRGRYNDLDGDFSRDRCSRDRRDSDRDRRRY